MSSGSATISTPPKIRILPLLRVLLWIASICPAAATAVLIARDGVDMPYWDQWNPDIYDVIVSAHQHRFPPAVFLQHNEHRVVVPKLLYAVLDTPTHWNTRGEMAAAWVIACLTSLAVLALLRITFPAVARGTWLAFAWFICNLLIFSPVQGENWLWGIGLINLMPMFFISACFLLLLSRGRIAVKFVCAVGVATAATFSAGSGMLVWPLAGALLARLPTRSRQTRRWLLMIWVLATAVNLFLYVHHLHPTDTSPSLSHFDPLAVGGFLVAFLGSPFSLIGGAREAMNGGVWGTIFLLAWLGAIAWLWTARKRLDDKVVLSLLVWLLIGGFGVGCAFMAAIGRAQFGVDAAVDSRYTTFAIYLPIGLTPIALWFARAAPAQIGRLKTNGLRNISILFIAILATVTLAAEPAAIARAGEFRSLRLQGKTALLLIDVLPHNPQLLRLVFPHSLDDLRRQADVLNGIGDLRPALIRSADARIIASPATATDTMGQLEQLGRDSGGQLVVGGWALRPDEAGPADSVILTCAASDGVPRIFTTAAVDVRRSDIAQRLNRPGCQLCGFLADFFPADLPPNRGKLIVRAWAFDDQTGRATELPGEAVIIRK